MNKRESRIVILSVLFTLVVLGTLLGVAGTALSENADSATYNVFLPMVILAGGGTPPCTPDLETPAEGATMDNGRIDGLDPTIWDFDWSNCPGATTYHLYVKRQGSGNPAINDATLTSSNFHQEDASYVGAANLSGWEWKVRAKTGGIWSSWSPIRTFTVEPADTDPPTAACVPTLLAPAEGATMDNGRVDGLDPIIWDFDWSDCPGATHYHLYVKHPGAMSPLFDNDTLTASSFHDESPATIATLNGWEWKVKVKVGGVWSPWSPVRTFNVEPIDTDPPPSCTPSLLLPAEGELLDNGRIDGLDPKIWKFDWSDCPGATHYTLWVKHPAAMVPAILKSDLTFSDYKSVSINYNLPAYESGWQWKVRAEIGGVWGPWSAVRTFDVEPVDTDAPSLCLPTLMDPPNGAVMDNGRTDGLEGLIWSFDWSDCTGASAYHLYVKRIGATYPMVDEEAVLTSTYIHSVPSFAIPAGHLDGWYWNVRAKKGGIWGPWTDKRIFTVEPPDTDPAP